LVFWRIAFEAGTRLSLLTEVPIESFYGTGIKNGGVCCDKFFAKKGNEESGVIFPGELLYLKHFLLMNLSS
jgi:hypothetical protein